MKEVPKKLSEGMHAAVKAFLKRDSDMLRRDIYEPAVSGSLNADVRQIFAGGVIFVHPEYDKHGDEDKTLNGKEVRPDILIHEPGFDRNNRLVIELKKGKNPDQGDLKKLIGFTDLNGKDGYHYDFGLFIGFSKKEDGNYQAHLTWFHDKEKVLYEILNADSGIPG